MDTFLTVASAALAAAGYSFMILAILRGTVRPSLVSWVIWMALDWIVFASMYRSGTLNGAVVVYAVGATVTTLVLIRHGERSWGRTDQACAALAAAAAALLIASPDAPYALAVSLFGMQVGSVPTVRNVLADPSRESKPVWWLYWTACLLTVLGVKEWTVDEALQPVTFIASQSVLIALLYRRPATTPAKPAPTSSPDA